MTAAQLDNSCVRVRSVAVVPGGKSEHEFCVNKCALTIPIEFRRCLALRAALSRAAGAGVAVLMALVGAGRGIDRFDGRGRYSTAFLKPASGGTPRRSSRCLGISHTIYLNSFFPARIHNPWHDFCDFAPGDLSVVKGLAEYFGGTMIVQYVGLAAVTDLRNHIYEKLIRQPIGFFQNHTIGRLMSAVINDVERVRIALSDWLADFFRQVFSLVALRWQ